MSSRDSKCFCKVDHNKPCFSISRSFLCECGEWPDGVEGGSHSAPELLRESKCHGETMQESGCLQHQGQVPTLVQGCLLSSASYTQNHPPHSFTSFPGLRTSSKIPLFCRTARAKLWQLKSLQRLTRCVSHRKCWQRKHSSLSFLPSGRKTTPRQQACGCRFQEKQGRLVQSLLSLEPHTTYQEPKASVPALSELQANLQGQLLAPPHLSYGAWSNSLTSLCLCFLFA